MYELRSCNVASVLATSRTPVIVHARRRSLFSSLDAACLTVISIIIHNVTLSSTSNRFPEFRLLATRCRVSQSLLERRDVVGYLVLVLVLVLEVTVLQLVLVLVVVVYLYFPLGYLKHICRNAALDATRSHREIHV